jgi:hypothetical protein
MIRSGSFADGVAGDVKIRTSAVSSHFGGGSGGISTRTLVVPASDEAEDAASRSFGGGDEACGVRSRVQPSAIAQVTTKK